MSTTPKTIPQKFQAGDRVAERPKATSMPGLTKDVLERISQYKTQRYGVVIDVFVKVTAAKTKRPSRQNYVTVLWDGHSNTSEHAQLRLVHEADHPQVLDEYRQAIGG